MNIEYLEFYRTIWGPEMIHDHGVRITAKDGSKIIYIVPDGEFHVEVLTYDEFHSKYTVVTKEKNG